MMKNWQDVWQRVSNGQRDVSRRAEPIPQPGPSQLTLAAVDRASFPEPRGALEEARRQIDPLLGTSPIGVVAEAGASVASESLARVTPGTLRILRAAAAIGDRFEVEVVGQLLGLDELSVLDAVQEAIDVGLSLEDRGQGVLRFEPRVGAALREQTLPALTRAWHERLAERFGGGPAPSDAIDAQPSSPPLAAAALANVASELAGRKSVTSGALAQATSTRSASNQSPTDTLGDTRGERELASAERLALLGQHEQALASSARALALADAVDDPERQRVLRARALLMMGQSRWQYRGSAAASLELALEPLAQARALVAGDEPPELSAQIASMIANVCYDVGTPEALERALVELTRASQVLLAAERPLDAARLLNDEAALWVKIGDPDRAHALLARSQEVFGKLANCCPAAQIELLETEHLLARLVLHVGARPGREREAARLAIQHALAAEHGYRELKDQRQLGRVWETLGRLELRLGRLDEAAQRLEDAQRLQRQIGDAIGLARSSGAMSDVFVAARDYPQALSSLAESVALNSEKGSGAGLQFNLASLREIERQLPDGLLPEAQALGQRLVRALSVS